MGSYTHTLIRYIELPNGDTLCALGALRGAMTAKTSSGSHWLREQAHKATHEEDKSKLRWLDRHLANCELESINRALIDAITEAKRAEGCSNATVNRTLALLRAILRKCARDWEWLDRAPPVRLLKEPTPRMRFLSQDQARMLLRELPPHLRDMATFTRSLSVERGLAPATLKIYLPVVSQLLLDRFGSRAYSATPTTGDGHYRLCATLRSGFLPETHQARAHRLALIPGPLAASW
jgi:hypothetical protein